tara:strand:- start:859 stop:2064 length:1206 start_codon:yes stop_codon:yes gene_type:complete
LSIYKREIFKRLFKYGLKQTFILYRDEYLFRKINNSLKSNNDLITLYKSLNFSKKNILIRYENQFARRNSDHPFLKRGYQYTRCRKLAYKLILKGNNIDVSGYDYEKKRFKYYDHVIANYSGINPPKGKFTNVLIFSTSWPSFNNKAEKKRINEFNKEYKLNLNPVRQIPKVKVSELKKYDDIYLIGNKWTLSTYPKSLQGKIKLIPNQPSFYSLELINPVILKNKIPTKLIFFGSSAGLIHKGLDLAIKAVNEINNNNIELLIMGKMDGEIKVIKALEKLMQNRIINKIGWVDVGSKKFINIFKEASFCLSPTCSEGQSESLLNCMANGIIPITTKMSGIDVDKNCIEVENNVESIKKGIQKAIYFKKDELYNMRKNCIKYVNELRKISEEMENDIIRNM